MNMKGIAAEGNVTISTRKISTAAVRIILGIWLMPSSFISIPLTTSPTRYWPSPSKRLMSSIACTVRGEELSSAKLTMRKVISPSSPL